MTQFTTLTELEILNEAYMSILDKWARNDERYMESVKAGEPDIISKHHRDKYKAKLDELHDAIVALENAKGE